jgi:hypothetical protein
MGIEPCAGIWLTEFNKSVIPDRPFTGVDGLNQQFVPAAAFFSIPGSFRFGKSVNQLSTAIICPRWL